ncbi:MAG: glycosyltransferase family 1 protein [Microbacteriaceae bacterium]|nr:glycosyltransferase family 1 protein [Microbacteriaceae bacterium]
MSSIVIASVPIHGHVTPLLAVARHLVDRGDRVRFITGARFAEQVNATGATHIPLPPDADFDDRMDFDRVFPERAALKGAKALAFDIVHIFVKPSRGQARAVREAHAAEPIDVLLTDPAYAGAAMLLGGPREDRPAIVMCGVLPLGLGSRDTAPNGMGLLPVPGPIGRVRNALLASLVMGTVFQPVIEVANDIALEETGRPLAFNPLDWGRQAEAIVQFTVPEFEYPRSDAPAGLRFAGPLSATGSSAPLPEWWGELDGSRPVVHVTQGTIANKDWSQLVAPAVEALAEEDVLVVVATGGRPLDTLPPLPANARAAEYLPYDELLPKTDVLVTNGGYGGVQYALRHGVPIVTTSGKEDKPEVAARVLWSGVGRRIKRETARPGEIRSAVRDVLRQPRFREHAARLQAAMAASGGMHVLEEAIDGLSARVRLEA